jgi:hypothetical protein
MHERSFKSFRVAFFVIAFSTGVTHASSRSIVGSYYALTEAGDCTQEGGRVDIGPKSITQHGAKCLFDDVQRDGTTVTWRGLCRGLESWAGVKDDVQRDGTTVTWRGLCRGLESWAGVKEVTAHPEGNVLVVKYGQVYTARYKRCPR